MVWEWFKEKKNIWEEKYEKKNIWKKKYEKRKGQWFNKLTYTKICPNTYHQILSKIHCQRKTNTKTLIM